MFISAVFSYHDARDAHRQDAAAVLRDGVFRKIVFDSENLEFGAEVLVILNGAFVNPQNPAETYLKEGDEVTLLPVVSGG